MISNQLRTCKITHHTSSIKNSNFLLYSSISVQLNFINILNCMKCWLRVDWKQLMTLQLHAHFIPTYSIQLTRFSKGGYKSNDVNSPVLSWMETKSSVRITKFPGYEGKPTFFTHILADLAFFRKSLCIWLSFLVESVELYFWRRASQLPPLPPKIV